jgi:hypothetical protein
MKNLTKLLFAFVLLGHTACGVDEETISTLIEEQMDSMDLSCDFDEISGSSDVGTKIITKKQASQKTKTTTAKTRMRCMHF